MAKQRYIQDSFWTDPYIEKLDPSEKLLFLYFLTNPLCNVAGIYEVRANRVAYETGFDKEMVEKIKTRFVSDKKMLCVDDWIILCNFPKHQSTNPNILSGMQRIIDDLPEKVKALKGFESLSHFTLLNLTLPNLTIPNANANETVSNLARVELVKENIEIQIGEVIKQMEGIDLKNKLNYSRKVQRDACRFLIENYSFEKTLQMIEAVKVLKNKIPYFPSITTPIELRDKWVKVIDAVEREKTQELKNKAKQPNVIW